MAEEQAGRGTLQGVPYALGRGLVDSLKGIVTILFLDQQIKQRLGQSSTSPSGKFKETSPFIARHRPVHLREGASRHNEEDVRVLPRVIKCCILNGGIFGISLFVFDYIVIPWLKMMVYYAFGSSPATRAIWSWTKPCLMWVFQALWVLPIFLLNRLISSVWYQDIADAAYRHSRGRPLSLPSVSKTVADMLFSIVVQMLFLGQAYLVAYLPLAPVAEAASLVHMAMLYSVYAFEYKWFNMGWELHKRLTYIENNWPYFLAFGAPLALLTRLTTTFFWSGTVFSIFFPLLIISGNEAQPVTGTCDYHLKLFSGVIALSNIIFDFFCKTWSSRPESATAKTALKATR